MPGVDRIHGADAEARREDAVIGARGAAALDVTENGDAGFEARDLLDLLGERGADAAEALVAEGVGSLRGNREATIPGRRALRDDDDRERLAPLVAALQALAELTDVERALGHEDRVGAAGHTGVGGDPAGVPAHHLE